ncbi:hypothetical protein EEL51_13740 [Muribaculaceae bacterium Isolate-110 (HZI)]|nr:hypothetical protein EEL51_13740 [Muribaculaceae bacterium Isolate-110 (HZI)]
MLSDIIDHKEMKQSTNIKLANYFENKNIAYQPFNYAGIDGNAEIVGWQIVMFRRAATDNISAISMDEIDTFPIKDTCAEIFKDLDLPLSAGMKIDALTQLLGLYSYQDNILEDTTRYYFEIYNNLIVCGIHDKKGLNHIEIIYDQELKNSRIKSCL